MIPIVSRRPLLAFLPSPGRPPFRQIRRGRELTIIAGFSGYGGQVLCSDSQETVDSYAKKSVNKIILVQCPNWRFAISGAGAGPYLDMVIQSLDWTFTKGFEDSPSAVQKIIESQIAEHYKMHVWPRAASKDSAEIELLIAAQSYTWHETFLFHTRETAVNWCQEPKAIGVGSYLADYILDHLLSRHGDKYHLLSVAAYVLKKTRDYIEGCGMQSFIYLFTRNGEMVGLFEEDVQALEGVLDKFDEAVKTVFHSITDASDRFRKVDPAEEFKIVEDSMRAVVAAREHRENQFREFSEKMKKRAESGG